jgi:hypothetical protein
MICQANHIKIGGRVLRQLDYKQLISILFSRVTSLGIFCFYLWLYLYLLSELRQPHPFPFCFSWLWTIYFGLNFIESIQKLLDQKLCFHRLCNLQGSDLLQVSSLADEELVLATLASKPVYAQPVMPGYYHTGLYQRQSGHTYYHRNGARV